MSRSDSFVAAFRRNVQRTPDRPAVIHCGWSGGGAVEVSLTYRELDLAARTTAARLLACCAPGDRALVTYPTGLDFVSSFLGCLYAGVVPVPVPLPGGYQQQLDRSSEVARDADPALVLTDREHLPAVDAWATPHGIRCLATDDGTATDPDARALPDIDGDGLALLQYTSGSTSVPKGVVVTHANLLHNIGSVQQALGWRGDERFCSWLPLYHDMGLIAMVLAPLYLSSTAILMSPTDFLKRPVRWLDLIDRHDARVACAPNFAYDLCARTVTDEQVARLDLSRWRYACNGAEPVDAATLTRFAARFAPAGFTFTSFLPVYGLAEATLCVSGARPAGPPELVTVDGDALERHEFRPVDHGTSTGTLLVGSGRVNALDVRIVDPDTARERPAGAIGEVWVRGGSVAVGYWHRDEETRHTFGAVTADGEAGFLRTGDLGALHDGELFITGRRKEMLIIHGRNLYPHDIEREVRLLDPRFAAMPSSVFSVPAPHEEIVVVQELRTRGMSGPDIATLAGDLRAGLSTRLGVRVAGVVFVRVGRVRRTTSGKIQRALMRDLFLSGALEAEYELLGTEVRNRYRAEEPVPAGVGGAAS